MIETANFKRSNVAVVILAKDAAGTIEKTLQSVKWADELVVIDGNSTDETVDIVLKYTDKIVTTNERSFAKKRTLAMNECRSNWIFYVDSDETVSQALKDEVLSVTSTYDEGVFSMTRENYFLGTPMYPDTVTRLFHRESLQGWAGEVHESPITTGNHYQLEQPLLHNTHRDITSMLKKTNEWSEIEADLLIKAQHPNIAWWRLIRIAMTEKWHQFVHLKVGRYGRAGIFEGVFQIIDKLIVYTKAWERQQPGKV
jgi:glycosyltransferase involved in cell wall biosynthesis